VDSHVSLCFGSEGEMEAWDPSWRRHQSSGEEEAGPDSGGRHEADGKV
jgi:hypothetical protein